ncbi:MAG: phosphatase PAP2 family protein [Acidobacteriota bacterium]|nr:phosphatase PAP2 family protein [Acidobacteriota bacterium]
MKSVAAKVTWIDAVNSIDLNLCRVINKSCRRPAVVRSFFAAVSRLGDGVFWYAWMVALPLLFGMEGALVSLQMIAGGALGLGMYRAIKEWTHRIRPCAAHQDIVAGTAPLDKFSFPSGHTLHAVCFTTIIVSAYPATGWVLIPFTFLVALSRPVLGLHYPTDVIVGAISGYGLAQLLSAVV